MGPEATAAFAPEAWPELALGMAGGAAALAGLVFVAVSINIDVIVADRPAPDYAAGALIMLVSPVFIGLAMAIPGQGATALAIELLALAGVLAGALGWFSRPSARASDHTIRQWLVTNVLPPVGLVGCLAVAGVGLLTDAVGGLYWVPGAVASALFGGLVGAWMLLVEIRRPD